MSNQHHTFGGSRLPYLDDCRAFESRGGGSTAATDGTEDHTICESALIAYTKGHIKLDEILNWSHGTMISLEYEEDRIECVLWALRHVVDAIIATKPYRIDLERRITIKEPSGNVVNFGSADVVLHFERHDKKKCALLFDYKYGRVKVKPAPMNLQGHSYSIGLLQEEPELHSATARFLQPRIYFDTEVTIDRDELADYYDRIIHVIDGASVKNPPQTPSKSCDYCKHAAEGTCSALANLTALIARGADMPVPPTFDAGMLTTPQDVAKAFWCIKRVESLQKPLRDRITELLKLEGAISFIHGETEVQFTIGYQRARREVGDAAHVFEILQGILSPQQIMSCADLRIGALEDIYASTKVEEYRLAVENLQAQLDRNKEDKKRAKASKDGAKLAQADYWINELTGQLRNLKELRVTKEEAKKTLTDLLESEGAVSRSDVSVPRVLMKLRSLNYNAIDVEDEN
jgi:hypothetical protein